jgi:hypothetical protein
MITRIALVLALSCGLASGVAADVPNAAGGWSAVANADIGAMHDLIRDNHPGPLDTDNPRFNLWLEQGRTLAMRQARQARTQADYWRTLRLYANGFQDGHLLVLPTKELSRVWPGFLTSTDAAGRTTITVSDVDDVAVGATIIACDGTAAASLLDTRIHPYRTNAGIPHERLYTASYLFAGEAGDQSLLRRCDIDAGGEHRTIALSWRPIASNQLAKLLPGAQGRVVPELGVRLVDGVWFVSLPTFNWWGEDAAKMQAMIENLRQRARELQGARLVVIDLRGNGGGNSEWGDKVANILWGDVAAKAIAASLDATVDWRASALNARQTRAAADRAKVAGLEADASYRYTVAAQMSAAHAAGHQLWREAIPPTSTGLPKDYRSPFDGKVYLLTDMRCASACLDFVDIVRRMPGVVHVGQPTSADAIYIDNVVAQLPSGRAELSYSLKVYRHRARGNNEWYTPVVAWPGGTMTDKAIALWVQKL